ncbi:hypothetical protein GPJ56_010178 [Histomonas meleagridis]|uniref:uncharacterized protein n=1 Tax=Histomonas meleagridis TaxID=135588 RepID=UPI0035593CAE|nr:hypothetical protein GPJ56_010178 [Histomonas meleagridis]KAH0804714.1 hypothetical protein GO595_002408 [Histomonas meleagridis]
MELFKKKAITCFQMNLDSNLGIFVQHYLNQTKGSEFFFDFTSWIDYLENNKFPSPAEFISAFESKFAKFIQNFDPESSLALSLQTIFQAILSDIKSIKLNPTDWKGKYDTDFEDFLSQIQLIPNNIEEFQEMLANQEDVLDFPSPPSLLEFRKLRSIISRNQAIDLCRKLEYLPTDESASEIVDIVQRYQPQKFPPKSDSETIRINIAKFSQVTYQKVRELLAKKGIASVDQYLSSEDSRSDKKRFEFVSYDSESNPTSTESESDEVSFDESSGEEEENTAEYDTQNEYGTASGTDQDD